MDCLKQIDNGEKSGNKVSAEKAEQKMWKQFDPEDYLPVGTIKSYFSRRASKKKKGEIADDDVSKDEDEVESEAESDDIDAEDLEKQGAELNQKIKVAVSRMDMQKMSGSQLLIPEIGFQCSSNNLMRSKKKHKCISWKGQHQMSNGLYDQNYVLKSLILLG